MKKLAIGLFLLNGLFSYAADLYFVQGSYTQHFQYNELYNNNNNIQGIELRENDISVSYLHFVNSYGTETNSLAITKYIADIFYVSVGLNKGYPDKHEFKWYDTRDNTNVTTNAPTNANIIADISPLFVAGVQIQLSENYTVFAHTFISGFNVGYKVKL